jgi:hypothetical protein
MRNADYYSDFYGDTDEIKICLTCPLPECTYKAHQGPYKDNQCPLVQLKTTKQPDRSELADLAIFFTAANLGQR